MEKLAIVLLLLVGYNNNIPAQTGSGSMTLDNSVFVISEGTTEMRFSESSYFGPNAVWEIDGTLDIWSRFIWVAPGATFTGKGKIVVHNSGDNPLYPDMPAGATQVDGNNGQFINLVIDHQNANGVILSDIADPGYGTANPAGPLAAALNIGDRLNLGVDGANVWLNRNNLVFNNAGLISSFNASRMVITGNSLAGHVGKNFSGALQQEPFVFPVGITAGDYTPATVITSDPAMLYVGVQDYSAAAITGFSRPQGMDRVWHLYASGPARATVTLQHNQNTNGLQFRDAIALIQQYQGGALWTAGATANPALGIHIRSGIDLSTNNAAPGSFLTKFSLHVPSVFTPNGDGLNDKFVIPNLTPGSILSIYNRWNNEVYHSDNYANSWDGKGLNTGVYYYVLKLKGTNGKYTVTAGWIELLR